MEGQILKSARERAGLTQKNLAKKLGYASAQFISNAERGLCMLPPSKFKKLSKHLGASAIRQIVKIRVKSYAKDLRSALK